MNATANATTIRNASSTNHTSTFSGIRNSSTTPAYRAYAKIGREDFFNHRNVRKLSGTDFLVLLYLATYRGEQTGVCWPSIMTMVVGLKLSRRQVQRALRRLEAFGFITPTGRFYGGGVKEYSVFTGMPLPDGTHPVMTIHNGDTSQSMGSNRRGNSSGKSGQEGAANLSRGGAANLSPRTAPIANSVKEQPQTPPAPEFVDSQAVVVSSLHEKADSTTSLLGACDLKAGAQEEKLAGIEVQSTIFNASRDNQLQPPEPFKSTFPAETTLPITAILNGREVAFSLAGVQSACRLMHPFGINNGSTIGPTPQPERRDTDHPQKRATLNDVSAPNQGQSIAGKSECVNGAIPWQQSPIDVEQPTLNGKITLSVHNGETLGPQPEPPPQSLPPLPPSFDDRAQKAIRNLLAPLPPDQAGEIIAELVARLASGAEIHRPAGYVRGMIRNMKDGIFVPAASVRLAESKALEVQRIAQEKAKLAQEAKEQATEEAQRATIDRAMGEIPPERLASLRAEYIEDLRVNRAFMHKLFKSEGFTGPIFDGSFRQFCAKKLKSG